MAGDITNLLRRANDLVERVIRDEGGLPAPAPAGNGGLLSRETLQCAHDLLKELRQWRRPDPIR